MKRALIIAADVPCLRDPHRPNPRPQAPTATGIEWTPPPHIRGDRDRRGDWIRGDWDDGPRGRGGDWHGGWGHHGGHQRGAWTTVTSSARRRPEPKRDRSELRRMLDQLRPGLKGAASHERQRACYAT